MVRPGLRSTRLYRKQVDAAARRAATEDERRTSSRSPRVRDGRRRPPLEHGGRLSRSLTDVHGGGTTRPGGRTSQPRRTGGTRRRPLPGDVGRRAGRFAHPAARKQVPADRLRGRSLRRPDGHGSAILAARPRIGAGSSAFERAWRHDHRRMDVSYLSANLLSRRFWRHAGFATIGWRVERRLPESTVAVG